MTDKHTPGPWHWNRLLGEYKSLDGFRDMSVIHTSADIHGDTDIEITKEDAALIAAAPDLLEALESLVAVVGKMKPASGEPFGRAVAELLEARAVIDKAKGES